MRLALGDETATDRPPRLDRTNLLIYRDAEDRVRPVRSIDDWQKRRALILEAMQEVMGPLPGREKRVPLDVRVDREIDEGTYVQRILSYASQPDSRVPAYLLVPKKALASNAEAPKLPAVLAPLGTGMSNTAFSAEALAGAGLTRFGDSRDYARELAERGYVTLVPAYPLLGAYRPDWRALGYRSGTMKAVWDNVRGLDLLESLPFVRRGRFGAIGHSLGGHNSVYTAAFDERIAAVVSSCGLDSYLDYMDGDIRGWTSDRYMPKLLEYKLEEIPFDFHEIIAALAPRPCFINAPKGDSNFKWQSAAAVVRAASQVYQLYDARDRLRIEHPDAGHQFPDEMREIAYELFDEHLKTA
jgi:predicted dienelactone hydrolase